MRKVPEEDMVEELKAEGDRQHWNTMQKPVQEEIDQMDTYD